MTSLESKLSAGYIHQDLDALERVAKSLLNHAEIFVELQPLHLQQAILSGVAAMQGVKNMTTPINRIPAEVLVDIFALLPRAHPVLEGAALTGQHWPFAIPDQRMYLRLAIVCQRWRDIIFDKPSFWSVVSESFRRERIKIPDMWQVDRCPCGPLTIHIQGVVSSRMWKLLKRGAPRIRQLHINNLDPAQGAAMCMLLHSLPLSNLEHCKIHLPVPSRIKEPVHSLLSGSGAKLRSLYLDRPSFLPSNAFPQLTYLTIFLFNVSGEVHWSMGNLCHLLSGSPLLEELHIHLIWPYLPRSLPTQHAPQLNLSRLRAFTFHMFATGGAVTTSDVLQAFLPLVRLPCSCQRIELGSVSIDDLESIAPYILALDQPRTRMRLTLVYPGGNPTLHNIHHSVAPDFALEFSSSAQPDCGVRILLKPVADIPRSFRESPLLRHVEEVWVTTNTRSHTLLRNVLLPPRARGVALTILDKHILMYALSQLVDIHAHAALDTLCVVTAEEDTHPSHWDVFDYMAAVGAGRSPDGGDPGRIRRAALGYTPRGPAHAIEIGLNPTRWRSIGAEFRWAGRVDGVEPGEDGSEMENLLRAAPGLLKAPASIRSGWPVF